MINFLVSLLAIAALIICNVIAWSLAFVMLHDTYGAVLGKAGTLYESFRMMLYPSKSIDSE